MIIICPYCGKQADKPLGAINAAKKRNENIYCSRVCAVYGRRKNKTKEQLKKEKAEYDKEKSRIERKKNMQRHVEYCRSPEYRKKKKIYDQIHRAKKNYGELYECSIMLNELESNVNNRLAKSELNLINKSNKRKKIWQQKTKN
jgi:hypothetical protein